MIVRLRGFHNRRNLGGSYSLGISLDGQTVVAEGVTEGSTDHHGTWTGVSTADLRNTPEFQQVRHFYVHMQQTKGVVGQRSGLFPTREDTPRLRAADLHPRLPLTRRVPIEAMIDHLTLPDVRTRDLVLGELVL